MSKITPEFAAHVQAFFADYLIRQRDLSPNTILSYRDTFKLFLSFAAGYHRKKVVDLNFNDIGPQTVLAFLENLEKIRRNSIQTRNVRLAALHTFFRYVASREPQVFALCQRISAIPVKKAPSKSSEYLEYDEVQHILGSIDRKTTLGRRDYLLLRLLFETGLRAQEIANLTTTALRLTSPCQLRVVGKRRKERICPLRKKTAILIREFLAERGLDDHKDVPLFVSCRRDPLTRIGILRAVQRHVRCAGKTMPILAAKRVGAHTFRHAAAIHLLRAGNDISVVRSWLGHVSVVTTDRYTEIDTETKRKALEASKPFITPVSSRHIPSWKQNPDLLDWLEKL